MGILRRRQKFGVALKLALRLKGTRAGLSRDEINTVIDSVDDDLIEVVKEESGVKIPDHLLQDEEGDTPQEEQPEGEGSETSASPQGADGSFLKTLLAWLSSAEGQAFIKFIFSLFGFMI